ncbi:hypothetical protein [Spirosoma sp.]|uniref:hypothetical protein n=1 Tax=Spirosoma sp. TaxID=1899569 RepID=UPI00262E4247|nr:hypothetical protein [Spirosoma sp.]MCX6217622.1 hypothetical protein [Spirosoma sp.]
MLNVIAQAQGQYMPSLFLDFSKGVMPSGLTFTRASIGSRWNASGQMETIASGVPRIDYDPVTLACRGLLIELSSTNILLNSDTLSTQSVTVTATARTLSFYGTGTVDLSGAATGTLTGTGANQRVSLTFTPASGTLTLTVTGSVRYANLETGNYATSWVPTTSTSVARAAELCTLSTSSGGWYNASEGSIFLDCIPGTAQTNRSVYSFNAGSAANRMALQVTGGVVVLSVSSAGQSVPAAQAATLNVSNRYGFSYLAGATALVKNGGTVATAASAAIPSVTQLQLGGADGSTGSNLGGWITTFRYYPRKLTNTYLKAITL